MQVSDLKAMPHSRGGRIDLSWTNPSDSAFGGIKILRRERAFPGTGDPRLDQEIGDLPAALHSAGALVNFIDANLASETVYYYAVVSYNLTANPALPAYASAMTTTPYRTAAHLYNNLPALYRRYDSKLPPEVAALDAPDRLKGQLQRFIDMFGLQFDLLRSFASGMENFHNRDRVDGALLPLLASWIGWETNHGLGFDKQRDEIQYAPHYFRTTGIAASLRGVVNRLVSWDAHVKEFVHNVFLATSPEQLTVWEQLNKEDVWQPATLVSLDVAYEGRPATLQTRDGREWLFHHARQSAPLSSSPEQKQATLDYWHVWYKLFDRDKWLPAHHVSFAGTINKYPAATEDKDDRVCVFWSSYQTTGPQSIPGIMLALLAAGQPARAAKAKGSNKGPFAFTDNDFFEVKVTTASKSFTRRVTLRPEDFQNITTATVAETVAVLNREIPDVVVAATSDGEVSITTNAKGSNIKLEFPASPVATALGLTTTATGANAVAAKMLNALKQPFALADGDAFSIRMDDRISRVITFSSASFADIGKATAVEVAEAINGVLPGVARPVGDRIELSSTVAGEGSSLVVDTVAPLLFSVALDLQSDLDKAVISARLRAAFTSAGLALSASGVTLTVQTPGGSWLITDGPRSYLARREEEKLNVYNPSPAAPKLGFGVPLPPPPSPVAENEPAVLRDSLGGIWLFWSSRRTGTWKIWYNRFDGTSWGAARQLTGGVDPDREPSVLFVPFGGGRIWVFWSRKKSDGLWNIFFRTTTNLNLNNAFSEADSQETELKETPTNYDNREPNAVVKSIGAGDVELYFSSNRLNGWHVWSKVLTTTTQGTDSQVNFGHITHRAPAVLKLTDKLKKLYFRTNESQVYISAFYPAAQTIDARYSGSTTVDTRNPAKISLRKNIKDIQTYTYDTLQANDNWYARDTVGIYLVPDTIDQALVIHRRNQIERVLRSFLPIQVRTVFIVDQVFLDFVYTYDIPDSATPVLLREHMVDTILGEVLWGPASSLDRGPAETGFYSAGFHFLRTFDGSSGDGLLPDLSESPPKLSFRLFMRDVVEPEGE